MSNPMTAVPRSRAQTLSELAADPPLDLIVVGGGATGLGVALDAAVRGLRVALLEAEDFAKGTSSRATKLVHGGVRYLAQGHLGLVREALRERATLLHNAPHLAQPLPFVMPSYAWWQTPFYGLGLALYELMAGRASLGATRWLGRARTQALLPGVNPQGLSGGVQYWDAQFDDARLALALARSAEAAGAWVLNHCAVEGLRFAGGGVAGVVALDAETGQRLELRAPCVVNATGVWVDDLRARDGQQGPAPEPLVTVSQGVHLVVDREFLPADCALLVPRTADGRVLFAVPWLGKVILGTTDTPRPDRPLEPQPFESELDFILGEAGRYLARAPRRADVRSCWVGLRPLARPSGEGSGGTGGISREHHIERRESGLVSVTGGKWTTYRAMAEEVLEVCMDSGLLPARPGGRTRDWPLVGAQAGASLRQPQGLARYGSEAARVQALRGANRWLAPDLSEAMVRFAARQEYARTVEDLLARRVRLLFLDARAALHVAEAVAAILREETGVDPQLEAFRTLAAGYCLSP
ncbi:FAD-dependent oxidoreductase [Inhella sp.]|uniref:glycerol-3-phosphate dehydrogenase/oxidase n=1 Tax=Inhella sp. TaxID=1921806 RepID=UPI0035B00D3C